MTILSVGKGNGGKATLTQKGGCLVHLWSMSLGHEDNDAKNVRLETLLSKIFCRS